MFHVYESQVVAPTEIPPWKSDSVSNDVASHSLSPEHNNATAATRATTRTHVLSFFPSLSLFLSLSFGTVVALHPLFFPSRRDKHGARRGVVWRGAPSRRTEPPRDFGKRVAPRAQRRHITAVRTGVIVPCEAHPVSQRPKYSRRPRHTRSRAAAAAAHRDPNLKIHAGEAALESRRIRDSHARRDTRARISRRSRDDVLSARRVAMHGTEPSQLGEAEARSAVARVRRHRSPS